MRQILYAFLLIALPVVGWAQGDAGKIREVSMTEQMSAKSGTLIEKRYEDVSQVKGVQIQILTVTDLVAKDSMRALYMSLTKSTTYTTDTKVAILDKDELDGLITSLRLIVAELSTERKSYTEITYKSRSGFQAGAYFDVTPGLGKKKWVGFLKLERFDTGSQVFLSIDDLKMFLQIVEIVQKRL